MAASQSNSTGVDSLVNGGVEDVGEGWEFGVGPACSTGLVSCRRTNRHSSHQRAAAIG
jgi:hypothetical protein